MLYAWVLVAVLFAKMDIPLPPIRVPVKFYEGKATTSGLRYLDKSMTELTEGYTAKIKHGVIR